MTHNARNLTEKAARLNERYRHHSATAVLERALHDADVGKLALVSSFGAESVVLLHLVSVLGGWPGAYLAQKHFRHKTCKIRFGLIFWLIVTVHQFAAFDYLQDWTAMRALNEAFMRHTMPTPKG